MIKKYGLKTGQCIGGILEIKDGWGNLPFTNQVEKVMGEILKMPVGLLPLRVSSLLSFGTNFSRNG